MNRLHGLETVVLGFRVESEFRNICLMEGRKLPWSQRLSLIFLLRTYILYYHFPKEDFQRQYG